MVVEPAIASAVVLAALLAAVLAGLAVRRWLVFLTKIESVSMVPALAPGRYVLTRRLTHPGLIRRGDVLVVSSQELDRTVVKRVLGLPGEQVVIEAAGGIRVNGRLLPEPYVVHTGGPCGTFRIPPGHLLLLGDNRACSSDGRHWQAPYLPLDAVQGTVIMGGPNPFLSLPGKRGRRCGQWDRNGLR